ncbi:Queuine tRNA-ribosyltransferase accessory subunit 2-like protein [Drosera capensis]
MNFRVVKTWSNQVRTRVGTLTLPGLANSVETPCLLLSTRKGLPHFLSPDLLSGLPTPDSNLLAVSPLHFVEAIPTETISKIGGLHQMLGLQECGFAAVPRDSIVALPDSTSTNKKGASFETPFGRLLISPAEYMKMIDSLKPNWWVSLADEVPIGVSEKRHKTSVDRTLRWLDECITLSKTDGAAFGAIVGGRFVEECKRCAAEVAKRNVSGYWIGGFGLGENVDDRLHLLDTICGFLPEEKPRQLSGLGSPEEVLQGVAAGIDYFDGTYVYHLTLEGQALTFPVSSTHGNGKEHISNNHLGDFGGDLTKINLRAMVYRKDVSPIVDECSCYTCRNHTRAYLHHLLNVHEMLAQILLEIHNTHHYLAFFRAIRELIKKGTFKDFHQKLAGSMDQNLAPALVDAVGVL